MTNGQEDQVVTDTLTGSMHAVSRRPSHLRGRSSGPNRLAGGRIDGL